MLSFNAAFERFVPPCSKHSNAIMRMARIARNEPLVSFGLGVSTRADQGCPLERIRGSHPSR